MSNKKYMTGVITLLCEATQTLPDILKRLRRSKCYTQEYVASKIGISRQAYNHYESGRTVPDFYCLTALCKLYNIPLNTFSSNRNYTSSSMLLSELAHEASESKGLLNYYKLPENKNKYNSLNFSEKQLLYYFRKLSEDKREEVLLTLYIKYKLS